MNFNLHIAFSYTVKKLNIRIDTLLDDMTTILREKGKDLAQSCDKNPYTHRNIRKATWQHKNATKNFDNTTIADQLRKVSLSNSSHPTGVIKPVYERSTFPLTATAV